MEAQQEEAIGHIPFEKPRLTREEANQVREKESLRLSLRRVVEQLERSQNSRHRQMLERAKTDLEKLLEKLRT